MPFMDINNGRVRSILKKTFFVWGVNVVSWVICQKGMELIFSSSNSKLSYGMICGWWGALYFGLLLKAYSWSSMFISAFFSLILLVGLMFLNIPLIPIHDLPENIVYVFIYALVHAIIISSPILVNTVLSYLLLINKALEKEGRTNLTS